MSSSTLEHPQAGGGDRTHRRRAARAIAVALAAVGVEAAAVRLRGYRVGGNVVVRCREGHLFTTIWVPGASLKSLRLGPWRLQRCPVGRHWTLVAPVREADLSEDERRGAHEARDIRVP
jgi:hypothetical protein